MIQYEGVVVGVNRRLNYQHHTHLTTTTEVIKTSIEFKAPLDVYAFIVEVEGQYEMGTKFLMDIYPIPAFKE